MKLRFPNLTDLSLAVCYTADVFSHVSMLIFVEWFVNVLIQAEEKSHECPGEVHISGSAHDSR